MRTLSVALLLASTVFVPATIAPAQAQEADSPRARMERRINDGGVQPRAERPVRMADAQGNGGGWGRRGGGDNGSGNRGNAGNGNWGGRQAQAQTPAAAPQAPAQRNWNGGNRNWQGRQAQAPAPVQQAGERPGRAIPTPAPVPAQTQQRRWNGQQAGNNDRRWDGQRNGNNNGRWDGQRNTNDDRRWNGRNDGVRNDGWQRDANGRWQRRDGDRNWNGNNNNRNWNGNDGRRWSNNDWNRNWRNDRRYNWQGYRNQYRSRYHLPRYYDPYGYRYGYQRFSIGIYLDSLFYSDRYWLDDPYDYRLPPAPYGCRWVRYYDDVLLVDMRSGYVVDVIHDFFW